MSVWHLLLFMFLSFWRWIIAALAVIAVVTLIIRNFDEFVFLLTRIWYRFPLIGRARRLSQSIGIEGKKEEQIDNRWFSGERTLCYDFQTYLERRIDDPKMFELSRDYLTKVHELGRRPMGAGSWTIVFILFLVESLGFAYVLAGYTLPGSSEALQIPGALGIAVVLSIIFVFLTHYGGQEWHKRQLVKMTRVLWEHDGGKRENIIADKVPLEKSDQDSQQKSYNKLLARLKDVDANVEIGIPWVNCFLLGFVLLVAIGAFYVRYQTLETNQTQCVLNINAEPSTDLSSSLPAIVTTPDEANRRKGENQACDAFARASIATYLLLALVFISIQIIGWTFGLRSGLAGIESRDAYRRVRGFGNVEEYKNWLKREERRIKSIAQGHLANLQHLIRRRVKRQSVGAAEYELAHASGQRTFGRFLEEERREEENRDGNHQNGTQKAS